MKHITLAFLVCAVCVPLAAAQTSTSSAWEIEAGYNYLHSNAPVAGCGCFAMNGGTASVLHRLTSGLGAKAEFNETQNSNVNGAGQR